MSSSSSRLYYCSDVHVLKLLHFNDGNFLIVLELRARDRNGYKLLQCYDDLHDSLHSERIYFDIFWRNDHADANDLCESWDDDRFCRHDFWL